MTIAANWNSWLRYVPAAVLAFAACMKVHQLATTPYVGNLPFGSRELALVTVAMEVFLALWLISNWRPKAVRVLSLCVFGVFLASLAMKIFNGEDSCGCFGVVNVPPVFTAIIDVLMMVLLVLWKPLESVQDSPKKIPILHVLGGVLIMAGVTVASLRIKTVPLSEIGTVVGGNEFVIVEPDSWVGKQFPLSNLIGGTQPFMNNQWTVVLYHEDCPKCQELLKSPGSIQKGNPVMFVEIPPYSGTDRKSTSAIIYRKLSAEHNWFVEAPEIIHLNDGAVMSVDE